MKKTKILSALVVSSLVGAMTFGVSNPAVAASDINITGATGEGNEGPWYSGSMGPSSTDLSTSNNDGGSRDYEDWAGSQTDDVVNLSGTGSLDLNHDLGTNHGTLNATGGSLTISGGNITLNSGDSVGAAVNFAVNSGATLGIDGGSAILNSGDTISGAINATNGTLNVASGAHNFGTNSIIANNVTLTVGDEATLGITGGNVTIGTGDAINGTINNSSGSLNVNNSISVGSLTNSNTSDTAVVLGSNTLTVNNGLTNSGALSSNNTGSVVTNGTSSNTGNVSVDSFTVASGSLTNSGSGSIDANSMTVNQGATLNNSANIGEQGNSLSTFTNNGTTNNTGNIYSNTVTNNKTFTNDTDGTINATDVINNGATLTNNSTINTTNYTNQKNGSADATTTNNGTINATTLNNDSNFTNNADGKVDANAINNTAGVFTNKGTVGATSSLNTLNNSEGAKFVNENTVNASTVNNNGEYQNSTAGSVLNATTFNNNSGSQFINNGTSTIETLNNASSITGDGGTLNVTSGGTSSGTIVQKSIALTTGNFENTGTMTSNTSFSNGAVITGDNGTLNVKDATFGANVTQSSLSIIGEATNATSTIDVGTLTIGSETNTGASLTGTNGTLNMDGGTNYGTISEKDVNVGGDYVNNGSLTSTGTFVNETGAEITGTGDLEVAAATFGADVTQDEIVINGEATNTNATITATALTVGADGSLEGKAISTANGTNEGTITQEDITITGDYVNNGSMESTGEFTNSGNISGDDDSSLTVTDGTNSGSIQQHSLTVNDNEDGFTNESTGTIVADSIANSGDFTNNNVTDAGAITVDTLTNDATGDESFENSGNLVVNGDDAGNGLTNSGVFNNNGDGNILATVIDNEANGEFTNSGDIAAVIDEELDITNATGGTFTNDTTGTIVADSITNSGDFVNNNVTDDGAITTDTLTNDATGDESFENSGNLVVNGDDEGNGLTNSGVFNNNGDGNILATVIDNEAGTFTNSGDIAGVATTDPVTGETTYDLDITNESGATFTNDTTGTIVADSIENSGTFANNSTVEDAITTDTLTNTANGTFTNSGDLIVNGDVDAQGDPIGLTNSGTFTNNDDILATVIDNEANGEFTNAGDIAAVTDEELDITNESGATFTNEATGSVQATTITNNGDMSNEYADEDTKGSIVADTITNMPEGTLTNDGDVTANNTFNNTGTVNNTDEGLGTLNVKDGSNTGAGEITQGIMNIASDGEFTNNNAITIEDELNNKGILNNTVADDPDAPVPSITVQNSTNDAVLNNTNTINSEGKDADNQALITADTLTNNGGTINLTNSKVAVVYQADDISGTINVLGDTSEDVSEISITGNQPNFAGELNVGDDDNSATAKLTAGNVVEDAVVDITSGSALNVDAASADDPTSLVMDSGDTYEGDLVLDNGDVTMKDLNINTGDTPTTEGGTKPYYGQNGGSLTLENSTLDMDDASQIQGGDLTVDKDSTFRSEKNGFIVDNLESAGTVDGLNGGYEDYIVDDNQGTGTMRIGDEDGDSTADFTTDIYARSNSNSNSDHYGSDDATITATDGEEGTINISDWNLNGDIYGWDAPIDRNIALDDIIKGQVDENVTINFTATNKEVKTPIGWYGLHSNGNGSYSFGLNRYNPAVFRGQITKIAQYQNQLMIDDMLFNHTMVDQGFKGNDYIASNPNRLASSGDLFPPYQYSRKDGGLWVKMYGTFENLQMNVGKVGNNAYGTIIGADFGLKELRNGWQFMPTAYIGYNGAHQYWKGNGAYQNGGQAGLMGTWYKDNFMVGALAYGGVYNNNMDTPRGDDNTLGYFAGGAVKTAYNWRFAKDWSLQPNFLVAYNFFGQENWHTDFGQMGMMSGMLHGINIAPGVNLIWEKETFSIYGTLQYMYNVNQSTGGRAGNVGLPHVHMDRGYIQYGLGFNKRFSDRFSGFFQAVLRNVGRTGVGLQAGFQWQLGKAGSGEIKGKTPELKKTEVILNNHK